MKYRTYLFNLLIVGLLFYLLSSNVNGQQKKDVDDRFEEARELAFNDKRSEAIDSLKSIIHDYPGYTDVRVFMARVHSWEKEYNTAREILKEIIREEPDKQNALSAIIDIEYWNNDYDKVLELTSTALDYYPNNSDFLLKRIRALVKLEQIDEAAELVDYLLTIHPSSKDAKELKNILELAGMNNKIGITYKPDFFSGSFDPWHLGYLEYSRKENFGSLIFRVNYASRFNRTGWQFESDAYISVVEGNYTYLNIGYSPDDLFPGYRIGLEPYFSLPWSMELSAGLRYLHFESSDVKIYTGHIGKYIGNYWFSLRPFVTPKPDETSVSMIFLARRYFGNADDYIGLTLGLGFIPSTEYTVVELGRISSRKIGFDINKKITRSIILKIGLVYEREEYFENKFRNRYNIEAGIKKLF